MILLTSCELELELIANQTEMTNLRRQSLFVNNVLFKQQMQTENVTQPEISVEFCRSFLKKWENAHMEKKGFMSIQQ